MEGSRLRRGTGGQWELYDLKTDRSESKDVAPENPEVVERLSSEWERIAKEARQ